MFNAMKVPCPKCNPKGHKSEGKIKFKYIFDKDKKRCEFCLGTRYVDWIELATGGKKLSSSSSCSSGSSSSSKSTPIRRKDSYVQDQKNIHGHNLKIEVVLKSEKLDDNDMVMDFHTISEMMKPLIDSLDHAFLVNSKDNKSLTYIVENKLKSFIFVDCDPTAEMLAKKIYDYLVELLASQKRVQIDKVSVYENDGAVATYNFKLQIIE